MFKGEVVKVIWSYPVTMAGRKWTINNVHLETDPDGNIVLPGYEIVRMKRFVANEICGTAAALLPEEFEFLCDMTRTKFSDVVDVLGLKKDNIPVWENPRNSLPLCESLKLKKCFWHKVFSQEVAKHKTDLIPMLTVFDERKLLEFLRDIGRKFIEEELTHAG